MGYVVLKFIEGEYLESTLNGSLRFTRNEHFIDLEKQDKERGIGDKYEGSWSSPFDTRNGDTEIYMAIDKRCQAQKRFGIVCVPGTFSYGGEYGY